MSAIEIVEDTFTCRQEEEIAIFKILEGANILSTTVRGKDVLSEALDTVKETEGIKGVAFLYSEKYQGKVEHEKFMKEILVNIQHLDDRRYSTIFKHAIIHYLEQIYTFPKPIVGGMDGDIVPPSFATNLALGMQIATDKASFILPDLKFGLPPSPPLAFYLIQNLGPRKAAELIFTKSELTAQEALDCSSKPRASRAVGT